MLASLHVAESPTLVLRLRQATHATDTFCRFLGMEIGRDGAVAPSLLAPSGLTMAAGRSGRKRLSPTFRSLVIACCRIFLFHNNEERCFAARPLGGP